MFGSLARMFHTLRFLRPIQLYWRPWYTLKRRFLKVGVPGALSQQAKDAKSRYPVRPGLVVDILRCPAQFTDIAFSWLDPDQTRLWRYTLNYFDFLKDRTMRGETSSAAYLILDWIEKNPAETLESWEPFVTSRRLIQWRSWLQSQAGLLPGDLRLIRQSMFFQLKRLRQDLEYHILANHLFENAKTLFLISLYLCGFPEFSSEHRRLLGWIRISARELKNQIAEQILPDGGHYELSPMYHQAVLSGLKEILASQPAMKAMGSEIPGDYAELFSTCTSARAKMETWLRHLSHPDGRYALFNDSAFEAESDLGENPSHPDRNPDVPAGVETVFLKESGFMTRRWGDNYFVLDVNDPSPPFQPGHSHGDTLSFELSMNGRRVIVDSGCGSYQDQKIRAYCRGTEAHNVPWIRGCEQSELWNSFRVGRRSRVLGASISPDQNTFSASFQDYHGNRFSRQVRFQGEEIRLVDQVESGSPSQAFESLLHLAPGFMVLQQSDHDILLQDHHGRILISSPNPFLTEDSACYPEFGRREPNIRLRFSGNEAKRIAYAIKRLS